jgi:anti-anti-sigma factor
MSRTISPTLPVRRLTAPATLRGDFALVLLQGELDAGTAVGALSRLHAMLDAGAREVLVDLSEITAINEAGIATLHEAAEAIGERGGRVFLFHAGDELAARLNVPG